MRDRLVAAILAFLNETDLLTVEDVRAALETEIDAAGPGALLDLKERLAADLGWTYYPRDPLAQRIHHLLADRFLQPGSRVLGAEHLADVQSGPVAIFVNHLSYADANVVEVLLQRSGGTSGALLANRLTAIAGPKVFSSRQRRFSSLCFGTIKVPQSTEVASGEAMLSVREVARAARQAIDVAHARLDRGDALLIFAEGTRTRTGGMQRLLPGVARYLQLPGIQILPIGLAGPEALFPVGTDRIQPAHATMRLGRPISADELLRRSRGERRLVMDAIGLSVARLLPPEYRGVYESEQSLGDAIGVLTD
jgi:1-acyl-sn-glycerol-3-phosphate acyltransferase